jgi:hypothetical protein
MLASREADLSEPKKRHVGFKRSRLKRAEKKTNIDRFRGHFGSTPNVIAEILEDLQTTEVEDVIVEKTLGLALLPLHVRLDERLFHCLFLRHHVSFVVLLLFLLELMTGKPANEYLEALYRI